MNTKLTRLSEKYRKSTVNQMYIESRAFEAGYRAGEAAKENEIQNLIDKLEQSKGFNFSALKVYYFSDQQEQMRYAQEVDNTIKILKKLL